jgi:hypothetical protein
LRKESVCFSTIRIVHNNFARCYRFCERASQNRKKMPVRGGEAAAECIRKVWSIISSQAAQLADHRYRRLPRAAKVDFRVRAGSPFVDLQVESAPRLTQIA